MGQHIDSEGRFQSDKYPELGPDKIVVSFRHPEARTALYVLAVGYESTDAELSADILARLASIGGDAQSASYEAPRAELIRSISVAAEIIGRQYEEHRAADALAAQIEDVMAHEGLTCRIPEVDQALRRFHQARTRSRPGHMPKTRQIEKGEPR